MQKNNCKSRLTPVRFSHKAYDVYWVFKCDCGKEVIKKLTLYTTSRIKSCGCLREDLLTKHGFRRKDKTSKTYSSWRAMRTRCNNTNYMDSKLYSEKGIKVCERWDNFNNFLEDMGERPEGKTLDRIDGTKGYYKENCRWATPQEQTNNRYCVKKVEFNGKTLTLFEWSELLGIKHSVLYRRIFVDKWSKEKSFLTPPK